MSSPKPTIAFVVAMSQNRVIGINNDLPWRLPADMKWFVEVTMGKPVIMGRRTYDSIPDRFRPLRGRHNIVVTRNRDYIAPGATVVYSPTAALTAAAADNPTEIIVGGGAILYEALLPQANRLYVTLVAVDLIGDAFFPPLDWSQWVVSYRQEYEADDRHPYAFTWLILDRERSA
jgi:dihydrofolate reductase